MKKNIVFLSMIIRSSIFLSLLSLVARVDSSPFFDPYISIQYSKAFDQQALYQKNKNLMYRLGCAKNVFKSQAQQGRILVHENISGNYDFDANLSGVVSAQEIIDFEKSCMNILNSARRNALAEPVVDAAGEIAFTGLLAFALKNAIAGDSVGGSMSLFSSIVTSLSILKNSLRPLYNLTAWPDNSLKILEDHFAKNKCYIPAVLWPKIIAEFALARIYKTSAERHTNFIDFALGFTVYKPKPLIIFKDDMSLQDVKNELHKRIDDFFADYTGITDITYIKINVSKFIDALVERDASKAVEQGSRYIYLYGPGGIGKTHFVQTLANWIDELIPVSVRFEDLVISSPHDLEGNSELPGAFLKVLRNQLIQNKRGSILIIDEATWLNDPYMISSAKRMFNGDRSKLITSYFGSNIDGTGVSLELPAMLIFVASNDPIIDPALASRFDTVYYPAPTEPALVAHAINIAEKSKVLKEANCPINKDAIAAVINNLDAKNRNFRFVAGNIESFLLALRDYEKSYKVKDSIYAM